MEPFEIYSSAFNRYLRDMGAIMYGVRVFDKTRRLK